MKKGFAKAVLEANSKSKIKRLVAQADPEDLDSLDSVAEELYDDLKAGNKEQFKKTLKAAFEIASNK